ncbi:MAG: thioredoxin family protein [Clostridia bacterium]|nr:thioredoxin family protein [Clostridia bacterium]
MVIKVLGSGCMKCKKLEANVRKAVEELGIEASIEKVTDFKDIVAYGVMTTPALVVDEQGILFKYYFIFNENTMSFCFEHIIHKM